MVIATLMVPNLSDCFILRFVKIVKSNAKAARRNFEMQIGSELHPKLYLCKSKTGFKDDQLKLFAPNLNI